MTALRRLTVLDRPRTWGECQSLGLGTSERACPFTACAYHTGSVPVTCTLRVAEWGGATHEEIAAALGVDRTRVRQIERAALAKLERGGPPTHVARRERGIAAA